MAAAAPFIGRTPTIAAARTPLRRGCAIVLIDSRTLQRECFVRSIEATHPRLGVEGYTSVEDWTVSTDAHPAPDVILFSIGSRTPSDEGVTGELKSLVDQARPTPVIVLAETEDVREMIAAVDCGVRGFIPASIGIDAIVEATQLTSAGGVFLPAKSVLSLRESLAPRPEPSGTIEGLFTSRQAAVADALRRGKANKIIAYELNMCESTVKIHIRNIMKKLKATNRTEAAFKLSSLFPREEA